MAYFKWSERLARFVVKDHESVGECSRRLDRDSNRRPADYKSQASALCGQSLMRCVLKRMVDIITASPQRVN